MKFSNVKILFQSKSKPVPTPAEFQSLTYADFADFLLHRLRDKAPPFDRNERHLAIVEIPTDWDSVFEVICWMNSLAVCLKLIEEKHGGEVAIKACDALFAHMKLVFGDTANGLMPFLAAILAAQPLSVEDEVFSRDDTKGWTNHLLVFGRAKSALEIVTLEDRHRGEALSRLGRCMVYATDCSYTRFGAVVSKLQLS